jgi:hypothetical protein
MASSPGHYPDRSSADVQGLTTLDDRAFADAYPACGAGGNWTLGSCRCRSSSSQHRWNVALASSTLSRRSWRDKVSWMIA